jgi:hypothetical protein
MTVPFWGILVSKINVLPFSGGATGANGGRRYVPFWGIHVFGKKLLPKSGHKTAQTGPKLHNCVCACPFLGLSYFEFKCFAVFGTCNIM